MYGKAFGSRFKNINEGANMKSKILSVFLCVVLFLSLAAPVALASGDIPELTLDFNKRYTDISEYEDVNDPFLDFGEKKEEKEQKRNIYVVVLVVLLIIAIVVFIRAMRRVPDDMDEETTVKKVKIPKSSVEKPKATAQPNLADEEKSE